MNKTEMASYLVSLHTLLEAQSKGQTSVPSNLLNREYERYWKMLKDIIQQETVDEAGKRK